MRNGLVEQFLTKNIMQIVQVDMSVGLVLVVANGQAILNIHQLIKSEPFSNKLFDYDCCCKINVG